MDFVFVFCDMFFYVYRLKINSLNNSIQELLGSSETCGPQSVGTFPYQTITCSAIGSILGVTTRYWHTARQCRTLLPTFSGEQLLHFQVSSNLLRQNVPLHFFAKVAQYRIRIFHFFADGNPRPGPGRSRGDHHKRKTGVLHCIVYNAAFIFLSPDLSWLPLGWERHKWTDWQWWLGSFRWIFSQTCHWNL